MADLAHDVPAKSFSSPFFLSPPAGAEEISGKATLPPATFTGSRSRRKAMHELADTERIMAHELFRACGGGMGYDRSLGQALEKQRNLSETGSSRS